MSDETQEHIENAAVAVAPVGFIGQVSKGVKTALETKKMAMAAYALIFGASVGTANITAGMSEADVNKIVAAEMEKQMVLQETVVTLETRVTELQEEVAQHEMALTNQLTEITTHEHDNSAIVGLIDLSKETVPPHVHEFVPHSHQLEEHEHDTTHSHDRLHEHKKIPAVTPVDSGVYEHKADVPATCAQSCHID